MVASLSATYRIAAKARLVYDRARDRHMLLYPERGLELNPVAHAILSLCDGETPVGKVVATLAGRFDQVEPSDLERDVLSFLTQLERRGLVQAIER